MLLRDNEFPLTDGTSVVPLVVDRNEAVEGNKYVLVMPYRHPDTWDPYRSHHSIRVEPGKYFVVALFGDYHDRWPCQQKYTGKYLTVAAADTLSRILTVDFPNDPTYKGYFDWQGEIQKPPIRCVRVFRNCAPDRPGHAGKIRFPHRLIRKRNRVFSRGPAAVGKLLALRKKEREYGQFGMTVFRVHAVRDVFSFDGFCSGFHSFPRPGLQGEEAPWSVRFSAFQWFLRGLRAVRFRSGVAVEVSMPIPIFPKGV